MKKINIKLAYHTRSCIESYYEVIELSNCASFTLRPEPQSETNPRLLLGATLTQKQAEEIAQDRRFEVKIVPAK